MADVGQCDIVVRNYAVRWVEKKDCGGGGKGKV
jgi:hypothetical protein